MSVDLLNLILYVVAPVVMAMGTFIFKSILSRLDEVERQMSHSITDPQARQLIQDKLEPLAQDIKEIKDMQQKQLDMMLYSLQNNKGKDNER